MSSLESYISKNKIWLPSTIFEGTQSRYITSAIWANGKIGIGYLMQSLPWNCIGKSAKNSCNYQGFYLIWGPKQSRCQPMLTLLSICSPNAILTIKLYHHHLALVTEYHRLSLAYHCKNCIVGIKLCRPNSNWPESSFRVSGQQGNTSKSIR
jgi:hypothetical protein